ncbi:unnamed protein product [Trichobilharzia szidati]|nr:unnamed protein product [Trichobilharzia szidati]
MAQKSSPQNSPQSIAATDSNIALPGLLWLVPADSTGSNKDSKIAPRLSGGMISQLPQSGVVEIHHSFPLNPPPSNPIRADLLNLSPPSSTPLNTVNTTDSKVTISGSTGDGVAGMSTVADNLRKQLLTLTPKQPRFKSERNTLIQILFAHLFRDEIIDLLGNRSSVNHRGKGYVLLGFTRMAVLECKIFQ